MYQIVFIKAVNIMIQNFLIIANTTKKEAVDFVPVVASYLASKGKKAYVLNDKEQVFNSKDVTVIEKTDICKMDMAVVLGGDGTVLRAITFLKHHEIPVFGINFGHIGYLTQCDPDKAWECFEKIFAGNYEIQNRIMIKANINSGDKVYGTTGVNEIVLHRGNIPHSLHIKVYVNGNLIEKLSADGVIVSTPTGSTAYNMSAGGPVVIPTANNFVITPVCAYSMSDCSVVTSGDDDIAIELEKGAPCDEGKCATLSADSNAAFDFNFGDTVHIHKSKYKLKLVKFTDDSFYQTLKHKLSI